MKIADTVVYTIGAVCVAAGALLSGCAQSGASMPESINSAKIAIAAFGGAVQAAEDQRSLTPETAAKVIAALSTARTAISLAEQAVATADSPTAEAQAALATRAALDGLALVVAARGKPF